MPEGRGLAVITGAARRIGAAIAETLHTAGYSIVLHHGRSAAEAKTLAEQLNVRRSDSCLTVQVDLSQADAACALQSALGPRADEVSLLVNNASVFHPTPLGNTEPASVTAMLSVNLLAPFRLCEVFAPALAANGGCVINLLDVDVQQPLPDYGLYNASKAGLEALTRSLAVDLAPVRVNAIAPGAILWPEGEEGFDAGLRDAMIAATPLQRLGDPLDIARAARFLACDAPFVTGEVLRVDGGRSLHHPAQQR